jgi:hypothetical protein
MKFSQQYAQASRAPIMAGNHLYEAVRYRLALPFRAYYLSMIDPRVRLIDTELRRLAGS